MPLVIACPGCAKQFRVADEHAGKNVKCPGCATVFQVPAMQPSSAEYPVAAPNALAPTGNPYTATAATASGEFGWPPSAAQPGWSPAMSGGPARIEKPGNVQAIGIMMLIGGIMATIAFMSIGLYLMLVAVASMGIGCLCFLWPGLWFELVVGIMAIVKGSQLLGENAHLQKPPQAIAVMQIINVVNMDFLNMTLGIIALVLLNDPKTRGYFRG